TVACRRPPWSRCAATAAPTSARCSARSARPRRRCRACSGSSPTPRSPGRRSRAAGAVSATRSPSRAPWRRSARRSPPRRPRSWRNPPPARADATGAARGCGRQGGDMEPSASVEIAKHTLMSCGLILAVGTITGLIAQKLRIPDVAVFLIAGMLIGPNALGLIDIRVDSALNQIILLFGASYVLFDGGASLRLDVLKRVRITIVILATIGVLITAGITGLAAHAILGVPWIVALLLGAVIASTDPATLVPIFRQVHIRDRIAQTVMSESAFNDATGAIVTFGVLGVAMGTGEISVV